MQFFRKVLGTTQSTPRVLITDKLHSYPAVSREILPSADHCQHMGLNNRAENSHKRTRKRERFMQRIKSPWSAQRFRSGYEFIYEHARPKRHPMKACPYRLEREQRLKQWR